MNPDPRSNTQRALGYLTAHYAKGPDDAIADDYLAGILASATDGEQLVHELVDLVGGMGNLVKILLYFRHGETGQSPEDQLRAIGEQLARAEATD